MNSLLGGGDDGEPLHAGGIGDLGYDVEAGHDEEAAALNAGLQDALAVGADDLHAPAATDDVRDLVRRVARESRGAHGVGVDPDQVGPEPDLLHQRQVGRVEHHHAPAALDVHVQRRLQAVEHHAVAVLGARGRHPVSRGELDDAGAGLGGDEPGGGVLVEVPRARHELGGEAGEDAAGARELEVGELAGPVALGGVAKEEDDELRRRPGGVVPPGDHTKGKRQSVALLHGDHLLLGGLRQDDAAGSLACQA